MTSYKFRSISVLFLTLFILGWGVCVFACAGGVSLCHDDASPHAQNCSTCLCHAPAAPEGDPGDRVANSGDTQSISFDPQVTLLLLTPSIFNPPKV